MKKDKKLAKILLKEFRRASKVHPSNFVNMHHGFAVLLEEVDELWGEVKAGNKKLAAEECIQVGAMAIRFLHDLKLGVK